MENEQRVWQLYCATMANIIGSQALAYDEAYQRCVDAVNAFAWFEKESL